MKYLGPLTKSGYLRIGVMLVGFYYSVQWITGPSKLNRAILIEDLRSTAQDLAQISKTKQPAPTSLEEVKQRGLISSDLLERCRQAGVNFHPENVNNVDGLAVFSVPADNARTTRVTATGLVLR